MRRYNTPREDPGDPGDGRTARDQLDQHDTSGTTSTPLRTYWEKHGEKIKWIVAVNPSPMSDNPFEEIDQAARDGAHVIYIGALPPTSWSRRTWT